MNLNIRFWQSCFPIWSKMALELSSLLKFTLFPKLKFEKIPFSIRTFTVINLKNAPTE